MPAEQKSGRRHINLPGRRPGMPYSDAVLVGDTLYLAGRIGFDPETGKVPDDPKEEIAILLDQFEAVLREAGMTMDDLVSVQIFSPRLDLWETFNEAYVKRFSREFPARAYLGSGPLLLDGRFELLGVAVKSA
jgi:2-iminobutanoate/2-iminopropanoate deaminase